MYAQFRTKDLMKCLTHIQFSLEKEEGRKSNKGSVVQHLPVFVHEALGLISSAEKEVSSGYGYKDRRVTAYRFHNTIDKNLFWRVK